MRRLAITKLLEGGSSLLFGKSDRSIEKVPYEKKAITKKVVVVAGTFWHRVAKNNFPLILLNVLLSHIQY